MYKCSEHLCFHNCSYEYKITLFILLDAAFCFKLCFVWQSLSRFFFCLHLPDIALPTLESFYFRWVSCICLIWEPLSSNKGVGKTFHLLSSHFGWPSVILVCVLFFWKLVVHIVRRNLHLFMTQECVDILRAQKRVTLLSSSAYHKDQEAELTVRRTRPHIGWLTVRLVLIKFRIWSREHVFCRILCFLGQVTEPLWSSFIVAQRNGEN